MAFQMPGPVWGVTPPGVLLRRPDKGQPEPPGPAGPHRDAAPRENPAGPETDDRLYCAQCRHPVTSQARRMSVSGSHRHVFANPHGLVFAIGCFSAAPGCRGAGPASPDFSWFPGMLWQIAICAACGLHLGWRYTGKTEGGFFGLILDRLAGPSANGA